ncbi:MAG: LysR family transcriptional regulator [Lachnospiraceae bacterium]|nr:LysR family transcriptional regulator [Lachnospiraceae bacterium]
MEISQLEYFIVLCKHGSYTRASEELHVSQPAISAAVKKLADECNDSLVVRKKGAFTLTPKGEVLLEGAIKVFEEYSRLKQELDSFGMQEREVIRLALPFPLCPELLESKIPRFNAEHTDAALHLLQEGHSHIAAGLRSKNVDLGIVCRDFIDSDLGSRLYKKLEYYACFPPNHPLAGEKEITPEMLKNEKLLVPRIANSISGSIVEYFSVYDFEPCIQYVDVFPADVWHLARDGEGVAFMPAHSCDGFGIPLSPPLYSELYVVWLEKQPMTEHKRELIDYICDDQQII